MVVLVVVYGIEMALYYHLIRKPGDGTAVGSPLYIAMYPEG